MASQFYAPTKSDKFAFGIWCLQNRGRDPFGDQTRPALSAIDCITGLAKHGCYGFEFHDNDIIPFDATAAQRDQIVKDVKKAIAEGRAAAAGVDQYLMGSTALPAPIKPTAAPLQ